MELFLEKYENDIIYENELSTDNYNFYTLKYLVGFSCLNLIGYSLLYNLFQWNNVFRNLNFDRQLYVVKNINKSLFLAFIFLNGTIRLIYSVLYNDYDMNLIRYYGGIYVSCDLVALLVVPNLPKTTKIHHFSTLFLLSIVANYDANDKPVVKLICIYTMFSYFSFLVNFYLGIRFFEIQKSENSYQIIINNVIDRVRILAYYNYLSCCVFNWSIHIYYMFKIILSGGLDLMIIIYMMFLVPIIKDDLILMSWLKKKKNIN
jgi:hypothetical protein